MNVTDKHCVYLCCEEIKSNVKNKSAGITAVGSSVQLDQVALLNQNLVAIIWMISKTDSSKRQKTIGDIPVVPAIAAIVCQDRASDYTRDGGWCYLPPTASFDVKACPEGNFDRLVKNVCPIKVSSVNIQHVNIRSRDLRRIKSVDYSSLTTTIEIDNHADTCVVGMNTLIIHDYDQPVSV